MFYLTIHPEEVNPHLPEFPQFCREHRCPWAQSAGEVRYKNTSYCPLPSALWPLASNLSPLPSNLLNLNLALNLNSTAARQDPLLTAAPQDRSTKLLQHRNIFCPSTFICRSTATLHIGVAILRYFW